MAAICGLFAIMSSNMLSRRISCRSARFSRRNDSRSSAFLSASKTSSDLNGF